jgi:hypothetical protein
MIALAAGHRSTRNAAWMLVATSATYAGALAMFSWLVVPIALERTAFAAFLPLLGVLALAGQSPGRRRWAIVGTTAGVVIAAIWATTAVLSAAAPVERRPNENALYAELARRVTPADVLVIFPPELQASAGYFLRDKVSSDQIHTTEAVRLKDVNGRIRLLPEPRTPDTAWLDRVRLAAARFRSADLRRHGVWVVDMGIRSAGDKQRDRLVNWLLRGYEPAETIVVGDRWMFTAQHYVLKSSVPTTTSRPTGWD